MSQHDREKLKLLQRVRKLRGQLDALERALTADEDCGSQLMLLAAARCRQQSDGRGTGGSHPFSSHCRIQGADSPGTS
jgi:hypothetical protein